MYRVRMVLAAVTVCLLAGSPAAWGAQMSVTVRETQVRSTPSFMGPVVAVLAYGDRVDVLEEQRGWARVAAGEKGRGWVHLSALTEKRVVLKAGAEDVDKTASGGEVALAGKGFNEQVEAEYREQKNLDYTWIDRMEQIAFPADRLSSFLTEGGLHPAEGGAR
ncbi:MAG: SH3 domain-containing protein [Spirochaetota bacterium]